VSPLEGVLWLLLVAFWGVGDTVTTYLAVTRYGGVERNPVPRRVFDRFGVRAMVPMKAVGVALIYVSWRTVAENNVLSITALSGVVALGVGVTAWNTYQILSAVRRRGRGTSTKLL
jgi:uncharacterized membrane protein